MEYTTDKPIIFMLITNYGYGGAQRVFSQLVNGLSKTYRIIKIVFNDDETDVYPSRGESISLNINAGNNFFTKGIRFLERCWKLNRLKAKYIPRYTISHLEGANYVNVLSFGQGNSILCVHGSKKANDTNRKGLTKIIENKILTPILYNLAFKVVTVSLGIADELTSYFRVAIKKVCTIQNGVDVDKIEQLSMEELSNDEKSLFKKKTIIFSGRLAPQKNPSALIDIYSKLERRKEINLIIVGNGPLLNELIDKCKKYKLNFQTQFNSDTNQEVNVFFLGFYNNPFKLLRHSTLFILTSNFEGFPLAPCEAMTVGLPIIATDCPTGTREILAPSSSLSNNNDLQFPEFAKYGILMPLVNNEDAILIWAKILSDKIYDEKWLASMSNLSKIRSKDLSLKSFYTKWVQILSE